MEHLNKLLLTLEANGICKNIEEFPLLSIYTTETGSYPDNINFNGVYFNFEKISNYIENTLKGKEIKRHSHYDKETKEIQPGEIIYNLGNNGYYAVLDIHEDDDTKECRVSLKLLVPGKNSTHKNLKLEDKFLKFFSKNSFPYENKNESYIGMILSDNNDFYLKDFTLKGDYDLKWPDLHYGEGFSEFNEKLIERLSTTQKGLVLLHGLPGVGKSCYVRYLIKKLIANKKYILYVPSTMIDQMLSPEIITFISEEVSSKMLDGISCVLLLEDAENILVSREEDVRKSGISNLLNITDGILSDILGLQIIATFNTELVKIDKALLRPERLIARKEFKTLSPESANELYKKLGKDITVKENVSLADIYSTVKNTEVLLHDYDNNSKKKLGFGSK